MIVYFLWLMSIFVTLAMAGILFWIGRVSLRIESTDYRQVMLRPLSRLRCTTIIVAAITLQLLLVAVWMWPLSWLGDIISVVVFHSATSTLIVLLISIPVFCELYARYCDRYDQSHSREVTP